ncbi:hypothetical protein NK983_29035, partial [Salmonella enterica subsp. enterica serovar Typhimurium]|nr:hypothetical protein [Salmonella enterica subsp. enterica serovar Typhimurium]
VAETMLGLSWVLAFLVVMRTEVPEASTFLLVGMLIVVAVSAMIGSTVPAATFASSLPVSCLVVAYFLLMHGMQGVVLGAMALGTLMFFA